MLILDWPRPHTVAHADGETVSSSAFSTRDPKTADKTINVALVKDLRCVCAEEYHVEGRVSILKWILREYGGEECEGENWSVGDVDDGVKPSVLTVRQLSIVVHSILTSFV